MNQEKINELFKNEEFLKKFVATETPEDMQTLLNDNNFPCSLEDVAPIFEIITKIKNKEITFDELKNFNAIVQQDELSENDLENVSGGIAPLIIAGALTLTGKLLLGGTVAASSAIGGFFLGLFLDR